MENKKLNNNLEETRFDEILNKYKPLMKRKPANILLIF